MDITWKDFVAFLDEIRVKARQHKPKDIVVVDDPTLVQLKVAVEKIMLQQFNYHAPVEESAGLQATTTGIARVKTVEESERPFKGNGEPRMTVQPRESIPTLQRPDLEQIFPEGANTDAVDDDLAATLPEEEAKQ